MIVRFKSIIEFYGDFFAKVMSDKRLCKPLLESILNIKIRDIEYVDYEETIQKKVNRMVYLKKVMSYLSAHLISLERTNVFMSLKTYV